MTLEVAVVIAGILALSALYRAVRVQWPLSYFPVGRRLETEIARSPLRFIAYRYGPVFVVSLAAGGVLSSRGGPIVWPLLTIGAGHAVLTSGRGVVDAVRHVHGPLSRTRIVAHAGIGITCVGAAALAIPFAPGLAPYVPDPDELISALWTAGIAAIAGAWLLSVTHQDGDENGSQAEAFRSSKAAIGEPTWRAASDVARQVQADERLVHSVMLVENIQRPRWIRRLERLVGFVTRSGSFGPLQVHGHDPSGTDTAKVEDDVRKQFAGQHFPADISGDDYERGMLEDQWRRVFLKGYNGDPQWSLDVQEAYSWLEHGGSTAQAYSPVNARDGLPTIEVSRIGQDGESIDLSGTLFAPGHVLVSVQLDPDGRVLARAPIATELNDHHRVRWAMGQDLDPQASVLIVRDEVRDDATAIAPTPREITRALSLNPSSGWRG